MAIIVTNQKPAVLDPLHRISCAGVYDPMPALTAALIDPLLVPLHPGTAVSIVNGQGTDLVGDIPFWILGCMDEHTDPGKEKLVRELLGQTLITYDPATTLPAQEMFAAQAGRRNKLPAPRPGVLYSAATDVIPAAKGLLAGSSDESELFATLAFTYNPDTLGFWFESSTAFADFQLWLASAVSTMSSTLPADTLKMMQDFRTLTLKSLTESLLLRKSDSDGNDEWSFARLLINMLMAWVEQDRAKVKTNGVNANAGVLPFTVGELFCPRSIVLVNVEKHARTTAATIDAEWALIKHSLASPVKVISNKKISQLTSTARASSRASSQANLYAASKMPNARSAAVKFRKKAPKPLDLFKDIDRVLKIMGKVNRSQNVVRTARSSFTKANRRSPNDPNKPGVSMSTKFMPDLHVYVDTSGSISQENYQDSVMLLIKIAKKLNVNLYFNSFSDVLSQEVMLRTANKSESQIWNEFRKVPKVTGGTDFKLVWDFINASPVRKKRLSLMITDFCWYPPSARVEHPKNLFYAPCSAMDWRSMVRWATGFATGMRHIDPSTRARMFGMNI